MHSMTYSDFRHHLASALDKVANDRAPILVTRQSGEPAIVMSLKDFKSYEETAHLMASLANAERLHQSIAELENHKGRKHKLIEE
jgi:antitoxin YefM